MRHPDFALRRGALLGVLRRLGRAFVGDLGGLIATGVPQDAPPQSERLGVRLEPEGTIEGEERAIPIAEAERRVPELVPDQGEIGVGVDRLLEGAERLAVPLELDERGSLERQ